MSRQYTIGKRIDGGAFAEVHQAVNLKTGEKVAVKLEPKNAHVPQLANEWRVYQALGNEPMFPQAFYFGDDNDNYMLAMQLMGKSLDSVFETVGRNMPMTDLLIFADSSLAQLAFLHSRG